MLNQVKMKKQFITSEIKRLVSAVLAANWKSDNKINLDINTNSVRIYQIVDDTFTYSRTAYYNDMLYNYTDEKQGIVPFTDLLADFKSNFGI